MIEFMSSIYPSNEEKGDLNWIKETLLQGIETPKFESALLIGPSRSWYTRVILYELSHPQITDIPLATYVLNDEGEFVQEQTA